MTCIIHEYQTFHCPERWLIRFNSQNNIVGKISVCGESGAVDLAVCNEFGEKLNDPISIYPLKDVFNTYETR